MGDTYMMCEWRFEAVRMSNIFTCVTHSRCFGAHWRWRSAVAAAASVASPSASLSFAPDPPERKWWWWVEQANMHTHIFIEGVRDKYDR